MTLAPLLDAAQPIPLHAFAAMAAFVLGIVQFVAPKGTLPHRTVGWIWVGLMAVVAISSVEFRLLKALVEHPRQVLDRDRLLDLVQGREAHLFDRAVDNQIGRLRRKIEVDSRNPILIQTVWGGGYMLAADVRRVSGGG